MIAFCADYGEKEGPAANLPYVDDKIKNRKQQQAAAHGQQHERVGRQVLVEREDFIPEIGKTHADTAGDRQSDGLRRSTAIEAAQPMAGHGSKQNVRDRRDRREQTFGVADRSIEMSGNHVAIDVITDRLAGKQAAGLEAGNGNRFDAAQ